eukprot:441428_1
MSVLGKRNRDSSDANESDNNEALDAPKSKKQKTSSNHNSAVQDAPKSNEIIILNVGGIKYPTTIQTLTGYQSMLKARFSSKYAIKPCEDGSHFIDRDGKLFKYILEYFRTGTLILPQQWNKNDVLRFYIEIKYFMINSLFDVVLLKLFDSKLMTNNTLKLQLIDKISKTFNCAKNSVMETLSEWKLVYEYDAISFMSNTMPQLVMNSEREGVEVLMCSIHSLQLSIGRSLLLIESDYRIYGMLLTKEKRPAGWFYKLKPSFAFDCGTNSSHFVSTRSNDEISINFRKVRAITNDEKYMDEEVWSSFIALYPIVIKYHNNAYIHCGSLHLKYIPENYDPINDDEIEYARISRMEIWSIPL